MEQYFGFWCSPNILDSNYITVPSIGPPLCNIVREFLPWACVYVSICVSINFAGLCDNSSLVPAKITWFGPKKAKHFAWGPYCFWGWLTLTFQVKFNFISKSCLFVLLLRCEIFVRHAKMESVEPFHILNGFAHMLIPICTLAGLHHAPWNSLVVYI